MVIKQGEEAKQLGIIRTINRKSFKIYDMPVELVNQLISYAKLYHDNEVWQVIEKGMNLIMNESKEWKILVDTRLTALEDRVFNEKEKETEISTLGGG